MRCHWVRQLSLDRSAHRPAMTPRLVGSTGCTAGPHSPIGGRVCDAVMTSAQQRSCQHRLGPESRRKRRVEAPARAPAGRFGPGAVVLHLPATRPGPAGRPSPESGPLPLLIPAPFMRCWNRRGGVSLSARLGVLSAAREMLHVGMTRARTAARGRRSLCRRPIGRRRHVGRCQHGSSCPAGQSRPDGDSPRRSPPGRPFGRASARQSD